MTLSLSENHETRNYLKRTARIYGIVSIVTIVFSTIYEFNSHGVYSVHMICLFLYPLLGGCAVFALLSLLCRLNRKIRISWLALSWYQAALLTFMAGSLISGILEIYGTTSGYTAFFWYIGGGCCLACAVSCFTAK